jgi:hypothetical protein
MGWNRGSSVGPCWSCGFHVNPQANPCWEDPIAKFFENELGDMKKGDLSWLKPYFYLA